jgi:hypothetical protein
MKCRSSNCSAEASFIVYWPGKETVMCDACTKRALNVSGAMGFSLAVVPITAGKGEIPYVKP